MNASAQRQLRSVDRRVSDLMVDRDTIIEKVKSAANEFSGTAYVAGYKTTGLGTKAWVRCFLDTGHAEDHDGPAPDPFPVNEEWYEVKHTHGDIHISRA